jgi:hypothetical protein
MIKWQNSRMIERQKDGMADGQKHRITATSGSELTKESEYFKGDSQFTVNSLVRSLK